MKLIVGLGNPGVQYVNTRHNMGFQVVEELKEDLGIRSFKTGFDSLYARTKFQGQDVLVLLPQTYMNLSGTAVKKAVDYFKIPLEDILVISDDMALVPGQIRLRESGSSGGQKGLQNIIDSLNTDRFKRLRVGIGEPSYDVVDYVLSRPSDSEQDEINRAIERAVEAILYYLVNGFAKASSRYNSKR